MRYKSLPISVRAMPRQDRPAPRPRRNASEPRRLRDWLATIPVLLLLPALIGVSARSQAATPSLSAPSTIEAGQTLAVSGSTFPKNTHLQLTWDGAAEGMPSTRSDVRGSFTTTLVVPDGSDSGPHVIGAVEVLRGNAARGGATARSGPMPLATVSVDVVAPAPASSAPATPVVAATASPTVTPTQTPSATPTATPNSSTKQSPTPSASASPVAPTVTPTPAPTPTPALSSGGTAPSGGGSTGAGIWISQAEIMALPTSGGAWSKLVNLASAPIPRHELSCQDSAAPHAVMATALVAARTNDDSLRAKVRDELLRAVGTENGSTCGHPDRNRPLGVGRNLTAYVIAADVIGFRQFDPAAESGWRGWLSALRSAQLPGGWALNSQHAREDHSNWGAHQAAALTAANAYLGDRDGLGVDAAWARAWVDPRAQMPWRYRTDKHDYSWSGTGVPPSAPVNPKGATKQGAVVDGIPLVDMQRGGGFTTGKPAYTQYPREALVGRTVQFELLHRAGYNSYAWGDSGLLRIAERLLAFSQQWESSWYEPRINAYWIIAKRYGAALPRAEASVGRQVVGADWTHR